MIAMNELLKDAVQPYIDGVSEGANKLLEEMIEKIDAAVKDHTKVPKNQPMLDPLVRVRIGLLINGEEIENPINVERNVARKLLADAVEADRRSQSG